MLKAYEALALSGWQDLCCAKSLASVFLSIWSISLNNYPLVGE